MTQWAGLDPTVNKSRGHVWSGGGAVTPWAGLDPTVNKRQGSHVVRGRGCVSVGQA